LDHEAETVESTSDERVVNNSTRQQYRVLSDDEKEQVDRFKQLGADFIDDCAVLRDSETQAAREFELAITHMEDAVMRAVRGVTQ
jgi:hypothetical protein